MKTQLLILAGAASLVACHPSRDDGSEHDEPIPSTPTTDSGSEDSGTDDEGPWVPPDVGDAPGDSDDTGDGDGDGDGEHADLRPRCDIAGFERVTPEWLQVVQAEGDAVPTVHRLLTTPDGQLVAAGVVDTRRGPVDGVAFIDRWKLDADLPAHTELVSGKGQVVELAADAEHVYALFKSEIRRWRLDGEDADEEDWRFEGKGLSDLVVEGHRVAAVETRSGRTVHDGYAAAYTITKEVPPTIVRSWEFGQDLTKGASGSNIALSPWGGWILGGAETFDAANRRLWLSSVPDRSPAVTMAFAEPAQLLELVHDGEAMVAVAHDRRSPVLWVSRIAGDQGGHEVWRRALEVCGQAEAEGQFYQVVERAESLWALGSVYAGPELGDADGNVPVLVEFDRAGALLSTRLIDLGGATAQLVTLAPVDGGLAIGGRLEDEDGEHFRVVGQVSL